MKCAKCSADLKAYAKFCDQCGASTGAPGLSQEPVGGGKFKKVTLKVSGLTKGQRETELAKLRAKYEKRGWEFLDYQDGLLSGKAEFNVSVSQAKRDQQRKLLIGAAVFLPILLCCLLLADFTSEPGTSQDIAAYGEAEKYVKNLLKLPHTADFPFLQSMEAVEALGNHRYRVRSYVDSQNVFGATIRTQFSCLLRYRPESKSWDLEGIKTW